MLLMMSENIARNMYSSQGIINYPTVLHFVGQFRVLEHMLLANEEAGLAIGLNATKNEACACLNRT
jgi:hypothetical protein